jgi:TATA-box binding protein (TBP) (component of TFIID and TFIIIB)
MSVVTISNAAGAARLNFCSDLDLDDITRHFVGATTYYKPSIFAAPQVRLWYKGHCIVFLFFRQGGGKVNLVGGRSIEEVHERLIWFYNELQQQFFYVPASPMTKRITMLTGHARLDHEFCAPLYKRYFPSACYDPDFFPMTKMRMATYPGCGEKTIVHASNSSCSFVVTGHTTLATGEKAAEMFRKQCARLYLETTIGPAPGIRSGPKTHRNIAPTAKHIVAQSKRTPLEQRLRSVLKREPKNTLALVRILNIWKKAGDENTLHYKKLRKRLSRLKKG